MRPVFRQRPRRWTLAGLVASISLAGLATVATAPPSSAAASPASAIKHVVVMMQENRSFDSYLGQLPVSGQPAADGEPAGAANPNPANPSGPPITAFHQTRYCEVADLEHSWTGTHAEVGGGAMSGFTTANVTSADPTGARTMGYYTAADLPYYYSLYNTFAMGDRYFSSVQGPTFPNRFYLLAGTSFGHIQNDLAPLDGFTQRSIFNLLDEAKVSWKVYFSEIPFAAEFSYVRAHALGHLEPITQYYLDAATGHLPQVSFVDPILIGPPSVENDEHPPSNVQVGEAFTAGVIGSLMHGPDWSSSALFLTYDEHGGFYDHVAPPAAPVPDAIAPMLGTGDAAAAFDHYGVRVPAVVVSPYSRAHFVSHVVHDHTSILRFIETRFGLPALTNRDAQADPMLEFFDFSHPSFAVPPKLAAAPVALAPQLTCLLTLPSLGL
ncbi:MAG TPA: alkaline phosphatase family protein [Acidimicrobiales bacterium]|nr:alkaline phosphatase family protein [Acidimicrobiales bacterium]